VLASQFSAATDEVRDSIYKEASALATEGRATAKHYIRIMEKIINGSGDYLGKEAKR